MNVYVGLWVAAAIISPTMTTLSLIENKSLANYRYAHKHRYTVLRVSCALYFFFTVMLIILNSLDLLILSTYFRYCDMLKPGVIQRIVDSLHKSLSSSIEDDHDGSYYSLRSLEKSEEDIEREKAKRRLAAYKEMANAQINEILRTMMTLKSV